MRALLILAVAALGGAIFTVPTALAGEPEVCLPATIEQALVDGGKLDSSAVTDDSGVDIVRCGDVTGDGAFDAVFSVASGGTAGDTHFGVLAGKPDGSIGSLLTYRQGYKIAIARRTSRSFEVLQPHYGAHDPNCCPSSFRITTYTWDGSRFKAGKARKTKTAPARFRA
jgi:hypothetical protein